MGRRIKHTVLFIIVIFGLFVFGSCGNTLLGVIESKVAAATAITIDFKYIGPFELSDNYPVYLRFIPNPLDTSVNISDYSKDVKIIKDSSILVPESELPGSESGKYWVKISHDLNNNGIEDEANDDPLFAFDGITNVASGIVEEDILWDGSIATVPDKNLMAIGEHFSLQFGGNDIETDSNDGYEPDNSFVTAADTLNPNDAHAHKLGWKDEDYIKLGGMTDLQDYKITILDYSSTVPINISIMVYDGSSASSVVYSDKQTKADMPVTLKFKFYPSNSYYLIIRSSSVNAYAMGGYTITFSLQ